MESYSEEHSTLDYAIEVPEPWESTRGHTGIAGCFPSLGECSHVKQSDACTICASPWRFWRRKYQCGVCRLNYCSACASTKQWLGGREVLVCDMCLMHNTHHRKKHPPSVDEVQSGPHQVAVVQEPMCAFSILEKSSCSTGNSTGFIKTDVLREMLSDTRGTGAHQLSSHQIEELLEHADINGEGMVNYKEFIESTATRGIDPKSLHQSRV